MSSLKVNILTFHYSVNCGAVLQAYALQRYIASRGAEVSIIDYRPCLIGRGAYSFKVRRGSAGQRVFDLLAGPFRAVRHSRRKRATEVFISRHMKLTRRYASAKRLAAAPPEADFTITGSDQVWNPQIFGRIDDSYFLSFVRCGAKASYAASFGADRQEPAFMQHAAAMLSGFDAVSVREQLAQRMLKEYGVEAQLCVDPVFLAGRGELDKIAAHTGLTGYVLVYSTGSEACYTLAAKLARAHGLKVAGCGGRRRGDCDVFIGDCAPDMLLGLIAGASCVVTDSFHGCALSIVYHKLFYVLKHQSRQSRIDSLLSIAGLEGQLVTDDRGISAIPDIDYSAVETWMAPHIEASKEYISRMLERDG